MSDVEILLPKLGESIVRATVLRWFKKEGDPVDLDEPLLEVSTDKVNSEIPSSARGRLKKIFFKEGEDVEVGAVIAVIESREKKEVVEEGEKKVFKEGKRSDINFLSPVAKRLVEKYGITDEQIREIRASVGGRISKKDIENYVKKGGGSETVVKMSPIRKAIAGKMAEAWKNVPAASAFFEVDVSSLLKLIYENKKRFLEERGVKLTITSFIAKGISKALLEYPYLNSEIMGDSVVLKRDINIGIAIDVEEGLLVPNIKNCDKKPIWEIAKEISSLAKRAKSGELDISEMEGGTITLTNFGMGGAFLGIPIIKYPEVAIVGVGAISKRDSGKSIMMVSLTFDHRAVDGMYGCKFVENIKSFLERGYASEPL